MQRKSATGLRQQLGALLAMCLLVLAALTCAPTAALQDEAPSLVVRAPEIPLVALASTSPVRVEKQVRSQRVMLQKPERAARYLTMSQRVTASQPPRAPHLAYRDLPRRSLPTRQATPRAPDDPSH